MQFFHRLSPTTQGYILIFFTMWVWGGFSLFSRINVSWGISAWDVIAMRFGISTLILLPIILYKKDWHFLFRPHAVLLAIFGGAGYSSLVYSAFLITPVVHGAVFLNGMIPVATAIVGFILVKKRPDFSTKISLLIIATTLIAMLIMMLMGGFSLTLGDGLFVLGAFSWSIYGILFKESGFNAWQVVCATALWSAVLYLPIYGIFIEPAFDGVATHHIIIQGIFHSIFVMIVSTFAYALAVERLGAFISGGIASLAPFISALVAVPLLGEPLNHVMVLGLVGMGLGTVQPWRFFKKN